MGVTMSTSLDTRAATHMCFRAMSTDVGVTIVGGDTGLPDWARRRVDHLEQLWSRFRDDSDITRLNRADGDPVHVSPETVDAVRAACAAWAFTAGCFDPTVHDSLLRLGYDDSIDNVRQRGLTAAQVPLPAPGCNGIVFDEATSVVQLPAGVRLDLGGIGKGLAADDVATGLLARGATGALVNIGGDLRVVGTPSASAAWRIEIEDPRTERICAVVELLDGGVATSTTLRRRWRLGATSVHHLIDPRHGGNAPASAAAVIGVSVVAGTAGWADALSKVPFVDARFADAAEPGADCVFDLASALVIRDDGTLRMHGPPQFSLVMPP
jgi:FAD:protein FMN transferase